MTFHRPIFANGLFGSANRVVANQWTNGSELATQNAQGIQWATSQLVRPQIISHGLVKLKSATSINPNQWSYECETWIPLSPTGLSSIPMPADERFLFDKVYNLREQYNTASLADGNDLSNPLATIGPVGSIWNGTAWPTTNLSAEVLVFIVYDRAGTMYPFFDRPNPVHCEPQEQGA
jgi:hypothetical protein